MTLMVNWIHYPKTMKQAGISAAKLKKNNISLTKEYFESFIGKKVTKVKNTVGSQPNPFKSGSKVNTVKGLVLHPQLSEIKGEDVWAFTFEEDDSYVEARMCVPIDEREPLRWYEDHEFCGVCGHPLEIYETGVICPSCRFKYEY